jgi:hypothetical protein
MYPTIGQTKFVTYQNQKWKGKDEKPSGEKWVAIYIDPLSYSDVSEANLLTLNEELKKSGYTLFFGTFGIGGPINTGYGPLGGTSTSSVFYFQEETKSMAEDVASIVSKVLSLKSVETQLNDPSTMSNQDYRKFILENSGLDLQIYLRNLHGP